MKTLHLRIATTSILIVLLALAGTAYAQDGALERELDDALADIDRLESQLELKSKEIDDLLLQISALEKKNDQNESSLRTLRTAVSQLRKEKAELEEELSQKVQEVAQGVPIVVTPNEGASRAEVGNALDQQMAMYRAAATPIGSITFNQVGDIYKPISIGHNALVVEAASALFKSPDKMLYLYSFAAQGTPNAATETRQWALQIQERIVAMGIDSKRIVTIPFGDRRILDPSRPRHSANNVVTLVVE